MTGGCGSEARGPVLRESPLTLKAGPWGGLAPSSVSPQVVQGAILRWMLEKFIEYRVPCEW